MIGTKSKPKRNAVAAIDKSKLKLFTWNIEGVGKHKTDIYTGFGVAIATSAMEAQCMIVRDRQINNDVNITKWKHRVDYSLGLPMARSRM